MAGAKHDQNNIYAKMGVLFSDGVTLISIAINPTTGGIKVNTSDTVSADILALTANNTPRANGSNGVFRPAWEGVSSADSTTTYPIFVDSSGAILVDL